MAIYVRDHLAGAVGGLALCRRAAGNAGQRGHGDDLAGLAREIDADLDALRRCAVALGVERPRFREALMVGAERVGRFKLNGQLLGSSPLSPLVEVEALILGVTGKASCWRVLAASGLQRRLAGDVDLEALERRALAQRRYLVELRDQLAARALAQHEPSGADVPPRVGATDA